MRLRLAVFAVAVFTIFVQSSIAQSVRHKPKHLKITAKISYTQKKVWRCQEQAGMPKTHPLKQPWELPHSRAYRKWVLKQWNKRLAACERAATLGNRAVAIAKQELGVPYSWGGASPRGFDCSGLTSYVYGRLGVSLPHNAAAQYQYGHPVDLHKIRPGDLLFFHGLGHVGLYIGKGRMIHAPRSGRTVEIQLLSSRGEAQGARRIAIR